MLHCFGFYFNILYQFKNVVKLGGLEKAEQIEWTNLIILMTKAAKIVRFFAVCIFQNI
jgi:hypothetical protein